MGRIGIYKDLVVSYQEFENALLRLGYYKVIKPHARIYINEEYDSVISVSHRNTLDRPGWSDHCRRREFDAGVCFGLRGALAWSSRNLSEFDCRRSKPRSLEAIAK